MRIEVKGRNVPVDDDLRQKVEKKFEKIARQVSPLAEMEIELREERNPAIRDSQRVEVTLHLNGVTLRARETSHDMGNAINLACQDMARQVKRHREQRRGRRKGAKEQPRPATG